MGCSCFSSAKKATITATVIIEETSAPYLWADDIEDAIKRVLEGRDGVSITVTTVETAEQVTA